MIKKLLTLTGFFVAVIFSLFVVPVGSVAQNYASPEPNALNSNNTPVLNRLASRDYEINWWVVIIPLVLMAFSYFALKTADEIAGGDQLALRTSYAHDVNPNEKDEEATEETSEKKILHKLE